MIVRAKVGPHLRNTDASDAHAYAGEQRLKACSY